MTSGDPPDLVAVLVAAAGERWEAEALERLGRRGSGTVVARRCVDLTDLLATAGTGLEAVPLVSLALPGLDSDSVSRLRADGVAVVAVVPADGPQPRDPPDPDRPGRLGIDHVVASNELSGVTELLTTAGAGDLPLPEPAEAADASGAASGRVLVVWGPAGAPGRTTVAVGLATELARRGSDVLLVDADPYGGTVAAHLGVLDEVSGLLAAARAANIGQLDGPRLAGLARQVGEDVRVLTGLPRPDRWQEVRRTAFTDLVDQASLLASWLVLDVGFYLETGSSPALAPAPHRNHMTLSSLERADEVVVVGAADPVGLARLARGLVELHELHPSLRPRVVVNRTRPTLGWSDREIRGMVEGFVQPLEVHFLPDDRAAADHALMAGRSLAESGDSALRRAMARLAGGVLGR